MEICIAGVQLWGDTGLYMDMGYTFVSKLYRHGMYASGEIRGIILSSLQIIILFVALKQMPSAVKQKCFLILECN